MDFPMAFLVIGFCLAAIWAVTALARTVRGRGSPGGRGGQGVSGDGMVEWPRQRLTQDSDTSHSSGANWSTSSEPASSDNSSATDCGVSSSDWSSSGDTSGGGCESSPDELLPDD